MRLQALPGGRLMYDVKRALPNGATHLVLEPLELLEKLAALLPSARGHLTLYRGVFAANAKLRRHVVPSAGRVDPLLRKKRRQVKSRWAEVMKRSFGFELLTCPKCGGDRRMIDALYAGAAANRILTARGESTEVPVRAPARDPPQGEFWSRGKAQRGRDEAPQETPADDGDQRVANEDYDQTAAA